MLSEITKRIKNKLRKTFCKKVETNASGLTSNYDPQPKIPEEKLPPEVSLDFKKEIYIQTQSWARHNETLIVATNTVLLGALAAIWPNMYGESCQLLSRNAYFLPPLISLAGIIITVILSLQYKAAITRVVVYERYFGLHADGELGSLTDTIFGNCSKNTSKHWGSSFVPDYLNKPPRFGSKTCICFFLIHSLIFIVFVNLITHDPLRLVQFSESIMNWIDQL